MLVLTRSHIGDFVNIYDGEGAYAGRVVLLRKGDSVRLGFEFSQDYEIVRGEADGQQRVVRDPAKKGKAKR